MKHYIYYKGIYLELHFLVNTRSHVLRFRTIFRDECSIVDSKGYMIYGDKVSPPVTTNINYSKDFVRTRQKDLSLFSSIIFYKRVIDSFESLYSKPINFLELQLYLESLKSLEIIYIEYEQVNSTFSIYLPNTIQNFEYLKTTLEKFSTPLFYKTLSLILDSSFDFKSNLNLNIGRETFSSRLWQD